MPMSDHSHLSDAVLLCGDDPEGTRFAAFYRRHVRELVGYLARSGVDAATAADVVAETFLTALQRRDSFDSGRGTSHAWLHGIMRHKLADQRRHHWRSKRLQGRLQSELPRLTDHDVELYDALADCATVGSMADGRVATAIAALPPTQRLAVEARIVRDESYTTIARALRISELTARQRVSRGLDALRRDLTSKGTD
jgi:RNA polymerase sigma factor (sigma-70 family)